MTNPRRIAQFGHPVLRRAARKIDDPADPSIQALVEDLFATVEKADGVGIAAPQVFERLALFLLASRPNPRYPDAPLLEPEVVINPEILWRSEKTEQGWEGCLSVPGFRGLVSRHRKIGVRYLDRSGSLREKEFAGFPARIFQHEFDHLQGLVFLDRLETTRDLVDEKVWRRRLREKGEGDGQP